LFAEPSRAPLSPKERRSFVLRKLHSLTGVAPIGFFLLVYLWIGAKAIGGRTAFDAAVAEILAMPYLVVFEVALLWVPLAYHALWGLKISFEARPNVGSYGHSRNWMYALQRASGILALAFIVYFAYGFRLPLALGDMARSDVFPHLCSTMSRTTSAGIPVVALVYLLGIAATVFHLTNGLYGFCFSWGITASRRATRIASGMFGVLGLVLFVIGANTIIYFATGSRLVLAPPTSSDEPPPITCQDLDGKVARAKGFEHAVASAP
jgi:succinate dehydrogenase/fumarate reductase cytochrome b subunit (b558 family)